MGIKEVHDGCIVRDNNDPQRRGRLIVECPTIASGENMGDWMEPMFHFVDSVGTCGSFWVPNVGSLVSVEVESGSEAQVNGLRPKWRCDVYPTDTVPEEFRENYPERRGWKTRAGHLFYFDDTGGQLEFLYHHPTGSEINVDNDGKVTIATDGAGSIRFGSYLPLQQAVLGNDFCDHLKAAIDALNTYATNAGVLAVPGVAVACGQLALACSALSTLLGSYADLSDKILLE